ncbi:MAG TPA: hypothetical protein VGI75_03380, partial [Pirellulales bacterium]
LLGYITPTVNQQALTLAEWTKDVKSKEQTTTATTENSNLPSASQARDLPAKDVAQDTAEPSSKNN